MIAPRDDIDRFILENYDDCTNVAIGMAVGLTNSAVTRRAARLGLPPKQRPPKSVEPDSEYVLSALNRFRSLNMGKWPGRSSNPHALNAWLAILNEERHKHCKDSK